MPQIEFRCPNPKCRFLLTISSEYSGQMVRCPACGQKFRLPLEVIRSAVIRRKAG